jgi:hypothetical protein
MCRSIDLCNTVPLSSEVDKAEAERHNDETESQARAKPI